MAGLKGIRLDDPAEDNKDRFERVKRRVESKLSGRSQEELDFDDLGIDIETV